MKDILPQSNCSEAAYKVGKEELAKLTETQKKIFCNVILGLQTSSLLEQPYYKNGEDFEYYPYSERNILDLFLDYFRIESLRSHWQDDATSYLSKKDYDAQMKMFCSTFNLPFKELYRKRFNIKVTKQKMCWDSDNGEWKEAPEKYKITQFKPAIKHTNKGANICTTTENVFN